MTRVQKTMCGASKFKTFPAVLTFSGQEGEQVRSRRRHWLNHFAKFLPLALLAVPLLLAAQAFQESNGIIDMDGERFPPENPREKADGLSSRFHYDLNSPIRTFSFSAMGG